MQTITTESNVDLATWNMPRTLADLRSFVSSREDAIDVEEFEL